MEKSNVGPKVFDELFCYMEELRRRFRFHEWAVADAVVMAIQDEILDENGFKKIDNWKGWLYRTARWLSMNIAKREKVFQPILDDPVLLPRDEAASREKANALEGAINQLPLRLREVFVFCVVDRRKRREAVAHFGLPKGTLHRLIATAYRRVREQLRSDGFDVPAPQNSKKRRAHSAS